MSNRRGSILLFVLIFGSVASMVIIFGVSGYAIFENKASQMKHNRDSAFHIAEAGISYYRWHLAHNPTDYYDGTGSGPGPYVHEYDDKDGNLLGYFSLAIDPPLAGSSVVKIRSTGWAVNQPQSKRTIQVRVGFPGMANYAFLSEAGMNFSFTTVVHGQVHSNGEITFNGESDSWVDSHILVKGGGHPKSFWRYPVPKIDFDSVSSDLDAIRVAAGTSQYHLTSSGKEGWHIVFNGDKYNLYKVNTRDCYYGDGQWKYKKSTGWYWNGTTYCYDIGTESLVSSNVPLPVNGVIFSEDHIWVEGAIDGRVTVGVGRFPVQTPYKNLFINNNLLYTDKASDDVIGLLAQGSIITPYEVPDNMEINAAILSQYGSIGRPFYDSSLKTNLIVFGSQISFTSGGWKWVNGWGNVISGFHDTNHSYDGNLKYYPPPGFPVGSVYELISWEEL